MKRSVIALALVFGLWAAPLHSQVIDFGTITAAGTTCTTATCTVFTVPASASLTLQISGTFSATAQFEATADGTNWVSALAINVANGAGVTSTTAAGTFAIANAGFQQVRVRASAFSSGPITVYAVKGYGAAKWMTPDVAAGTGTARAGVGGALTVSTTTAQTGANTTETDLWTYSLPANTLSADTYGVRITVWGQTAANGNTKTARAYFGATLVATTGSVAYNNRDWRFDVVVYRKTATTQTASGTGLINANTPTATTAAPTETLSGAVVLKVTGQNGTASAGDVVFQGASVEFLRAGG